MRDFSHLHCHTSYSLLDGAARIKKLVGRAAEMDLMAVGITDHGNLFGVPEFYTTAQKQGVQPVIGCEFYLTPSGMDDTSDRTRYHQVLWAKNERGYRNLIKLSSLSYTDGYYYKPRIDRDALRQYSEGLVATTCCLQGEVLQTILKRGEDAARALFEEYLDIFGDDYYIEIQDHGIEDQKRCNAVLLRWAKEYGVKVVATNDVHYVEQQDADAQDVLLCLQTGKDLYDPNRMRFENDQFYLKGAREMEQALSVDIDDPRLIQQSLETSCEIAAKCKFELPMGDLLMPHYPIPPEFGDDMDAYLRHMVFERAKQRYPGMPQQVEDRLEYELGVIEDMEYAGYFLIVQDFTTAARELDVSVGPGRGSAAGSAVAYCLGITNVDPLAYDLLFERFLNPERTSMPDIDIDFDDRGRSKVIDYVVQKYGRENVCQIITFGTMGAKTVLRDVSRVLGIPLQEADRIAKLVPDGPRVDLESALQDVPELRKLKQDQNPQIRKLMHYAEVLEGSARHTGVHAAGVIIAPGEVSEYVPIATAKSKGDRVMTTQYDGSWVEEFGLLKMDFLGLKTLTVLDDALDLIEEKHGVRIDLDEIPLDDETTFGLFQRGETVAVFQFESSGMREWLRKLKPTSIDDLIAMNALYRPGPMDLIPNYIDRKHGKEEVTYPHPMLEPVLEATYGIPVYQEQVMRMAQVMGGFTLGKADILRRCVTGDTLVVNADTGECVPVADVEPGMPILTLGPDYRITRTEVAQRFYNGTKPVYRVETRSGRTIELTEEHPLLTVEGWQHLCDLDVGDRIATPRALPVGGTRRPSPARVKVLAYLIGDGQTVTAEGYDVARFYNSDPELIRDYRAAVAALGGRTKTYTHDRTGVVTVTACGTQPGTNPIVELVRESGIGGRAEAKQIPGEVYAYDADTLALFLGSLFSTDGSIEKTRISYSTSSEVLLDDVAHLLLRLGVATVRRTRTTTHLKNYELIITDQDDVVRFAEQVGPYLCQRKASALRRLREDAEARQRSHSIYNLPAAVTPLVQSAKYASTRSWREGGEVAGIPGSTLSSGINFKTPNRALSRHRVDALGRAFDSTELQHLAASDVLWDPIIAITPVGEKDVFDLAVPPHANFIASDVVIHNSMGKKKKKIMDAMKPEFIAGAEARDVSRAVAEEVWEMMARFAGYGFNKSHSAAYSIVAYQTAYLKAHYPAEFMAAAMTNEMGSTDKLSVVLEEAQKQGLEMLPPSINKSMAHFTVEDGSIRFGLGAIKGVGLGAIEALIETREEHGPFTSIFGLVEHLDLRTVGKRALECLATVGALDDLEGHRAQLAEAVEAAVQYGQKVQADRAAGQNSLFGGDGATPGMSMEPNLPMVEPWTMARLLKEERDLLGVYVSGHPLDQYRPEATAFATAQLGDVEAIVAAEEPDPQGDGYGGRPRKPVHTVCGILTDVQRRTTKSGKPIAFASIEDFTGQGEIVCFSSILDRVQAYLEVDKVVMVRGETEVRGGDVKILAREIWPMWKVREQLVKAIILRIDTATVQLDALNRLQRLCDENRGHCKLYFDLVDPDLPMGRQRIRSRSYVVDPTPELMRGVTRLFGRDNVVLEGEA
ncbi:MAG: DNA polymerase III subunit alpha [Bacteroidetes bacterium]|jgi:DNA polymerase-3 subunit alpha|nr:DNA polymerase III subunit alpha [Bacteroidota bacterium]